MSRTPASQVRVLFFITLLEAVSMQECLCVEAGSEAVAPGAAQPLVEQSPDSLSLSFGLRKREDGRIWANYYLSNTCEHGVLICHSMELFLALSTPNGKSDFPLLEPVGNCNAMIYSLLDPPPPAPALMGVSTLSRHKPVPEYVLKELRGVIQVLPEEAKHGELVARMRGWVLEWDPEAGQYVRKPFEVQSHPARLLGFVPLLSPPAHEGDAPNP